LQRCLGAGILPSGNGSFWLDNGSAEAPSHYKNKTVGEYALRTASRPIGVATDTIVPQLPDDYRDELPSPDVIAERLRLWDGLEETDE
jgi:hypothetical protein